MDYLFTGERQVQDRDVSYFRMGFQDRRASLTGVTPWGKDVCVIPCTQTECPAQVTVTSRGPCHQMEMWDSWSRFKVHRPVLKVQTKQITFKTYELCISGIFHLIFLDRGWPWVTEIPDKRKLLWQDLPMDWYAAWGKERPSPDWGRAWGAEGCGCSKFGVWVQ